MVKDCWVFYITGGWDTSALDPGAWYNIVCEGDCRFMTALVREGEKVVENKQRKREAEEANKVEFVSGVMVGSLRRFRAALIGPTQGLPKQRRLRRSGSLRML